MATIEIPGFEILEKIGAGGMATVWKARQLSLNRVVAIKILYSRFASDSGDVLRFQNEAQAAARLKHNGIVQVYDANATEGLYYFVMEYVDGYTVGQWLQRKGPLPTKDALLVAECVADALGYAWNSAGIIHCDIKPDNVLVDADGTVKVSDLGLARTLSLLIQDESADDDIMGTPAYMAPEQAMGEVDLDFRADIYALGAMLYHMVTGQIPFKGHPPDEVMDLQINGTLADPMDVNVDVPAPVAWLIEKMMCKDPAGRQSSWEEVCHDFQRAKKGVRPLGEALPEGVSTVERGNARRKGALQPLVTARGRHLAGLAMRLARLLAVLVLAAGAVFGFVRWKNRVAAPPVAPTPAAQLDASWATEYQDMLLWSRSNPGRYDEAIAKLELIAQGAIGTPYAAMARTRIDALRRDRQLAFDGVIRTLKASAEPLLAAGRFGEATDLYAAYSGEFAAETESERQRLADEVRARAAEAARPPEPVRPLEAVMDDVCASVMGSQWPKALAAIDAAIADPGLVSNGTELAALRDEVQGAAGVEARILDSFAAQKGQQAKVVLRTGARMLKIRDVRGGRVVADVVPASGETLAQGTIEFDVRFLKYPERMRRMGGTDVPGANLYMGVMAAEAGSDVNARRYFAEVSPLLSDRLSAAIATPKLR